VRRLVALSLATVAWSPLGAWACGASAGGLAGLSGCSVEEHDEAVRDKWRIGASASTTSTAIRFDDSLRFDQKRTIAVALADYAPKAGAAFEFGAGALLDGEFERGGTTYDFSPGVLLVTGASYRLVTNDGPRPFVLVGGQVAYVNARTRQENLAGAESVGYDAFDLRFGPVVGWTFWNALSPYVLARLFGGPVFWHYQGESVVGGDTHHYQLGAGVSLLLAKRVDLFVEGVPLGELNLAGGAGLHF
jgi:hypothetical protein